MKVINAYYMRKMIMNNFLNFDSNNKEEIKKFFGRNFLLKIFF